MLDKAQLRLHEWLFQHSASCHFRNTSPAVFNPSQTFKPETRKPVPVESSAKGQCNTPHQEEDGDLLHRSQPSGEINDAKWSKIVFIR